MMSRGNALRNYLGGLDNLLHPLDKSEQPSRAQFDIDELDDFGNLPEHVGTRSDFEADRSVLQQDYEEDVQSPSTGRGGLDHVTKEDERAEHENCTSQGPNMTYDSPQNASEFSSIRLTGLHVCPILSSFLRKFGPFH